MNKANLRISFKSVKEVERFFPSKEILDRQRKTLHLFYIKLQEQVSIDTSGSHSVHSTDDKIVVPTLDPNYIFLANSSEEVILKWVCILSYLLKNVK